MTLNQGYGSYVSPLASLVEYIGLTGKGTQLQSLGTNAVTNSLYLGFGSSSTGTYTLSGGSLSAATQYVANGGSSTGTFTQSGGTNTVSSNLYLGNGTNSTGTYTLSGSGSLSAPTQWVAFGGSSTGTFTQSGGTNSVSSELRLGNGASSTGTYNLSGTGVLQGSSEFIGSNPTPGVATGTFTQSGGTNTATNLYIAQSGANGTYSLSGGSLQSPNQYVGYGANHTGTFTQSGGTNNGNTLNVGSIASGTGAYTLSGTGMLQTQNAYIGNTAGSTGTFTQSGGTSSVQNNLTIGGGPGTSGTYNLWGVPCGARPRLISIPAAPSTRPAATCGPISSTRAAAR